MSGFRELGDVVHFRLFTRDLVLVAHPNDVRWVLQEHTSNYNKRTRGFEVLRAFLRQGLLTSEGDHWLRQRRIAQPAFHRTRIAGFGDAMTQAAGELVDRWLCGSAPAVVDVTAEMMRLTLRIVGEALLSTDVSHEADRVGQALNITLRRANAAIYQIVPLPGWWPTPARRRLRAAMRTLDDVIFEIIAERRASDSEPDDLLSMLMRARDEDTGEGMSDAQLRDEVMTVFLAGQETTALALGWTWYLLSRHAAVRQRLQTEIDTVLGGRTPRVADLKRVGRGNRQRAAEDEVELELTGTAQEDGALLVLLDAFFAHERFERPKLKVETHDESSSQVSFSMSVAYSPVKPAVARPPKKIELAGGRAAPPEEAGNAEVAVEVAS